MKNYIFLFLMLLSLGSCVGKTKLKNEHNKAYKQLLELLDQKDYFRLESTLNLNKKSIDKEQELYFRSYLENAFNRNDRAIKYIDSLLIRFNPADSIRTDLFLLQSDCYFKTFQYEKDARICDIMLRQFQQYLDSVRIHDIKNHRVMCNALKNVPVQTTDIKQNTNINWTKDQVGLMEIPVKRKNNLYSAIFDTRANISCITKTFAEKLKLKILGASYEESSGITGIKFMADIGIADSLYIGSILVRNAVFEVLPDSILYIAPLKLSLDIIIGFPVIAQLKEIHIFRDGRMEIPAKQSESTLHNLALDKLDPVIRLKADDDTLCFHFDLGATSTDLYAAYYNKYRERITREGIRKTVEVGGAGGIQRKEIYRVPSFNLYTGGTKTSLDSVDVFTDKIFPDDRYYGNLGQDFISKFNELILNFGTMYIDLK